MLGLLLALEDKLFECCLSLFDFISATLYCEVLQQTLRLLFQLIIIIVCFFNQTCVFIRITPASIFDFLLNASNLLFELSLSRIDTFELLGFPLLPVCVCLYRYNQNEYVVCEAGNYRNYIHRHPEVREQMFFSGDDGKDSGQAQRTEVSEDEH